MSVLIAAMAVANSGSDSRMSRKVAATSTPRSRFLRNLFQHKINRTFLSWDSTKDPGACAITLYGEIYRNI